MLSEQDEADMLLRFAQGDLRAAQALTDALAPRVLRFAARMLSDWTEAEDVTQDTMLRLWRMAPDWQSGQAKPSTWAFQVARNLCTDRLRRRKPMVPEMPDLPDTSAGADARLMQTARAAALDAALAQLPDRQREAVILRHIEGLSNPQIAAILMIGVEAVESLTARGKRRLTALLTGRKEELGYDEEDI